MNITKRGKGPRGQGRKISWCSDPLRVLHAFVARSGLKNKFLVETKRCDKSGTNEHVDYLVHITFSQTSKRTQTAQLSDTIVADM